MPAEEQTGAEQTGASCVRGKKGDAVQSERYHTSAFGGANRTAEYAKISS